MSERPFPPLPPATALTVVRADPGAAPRLEVRTAAAMPPREAGLKDAALLLIGGGAWGGRLADDRERPGGGTGHDSGGGRGCP